MMIFYFELTCDDDYLSNSRNDRRKKLERILEIHPNHHPHHHPREYINELLFIYIKNSSKYEIDSLRDSITITTMIISASMRGFDFRFYYGNEEYRYDFNCCRIRQTPVDSTYIIIWMWLIYWYNTWKSLE
jgi:hypothetical protein